MQSQSGAKAPFPLWLVILSAATIVGIAMGLRNVMGLYLVPVTGSLQIGREAFGLAMAVANIVWGAGSPFAGAVSDKYGTGRVIVTGAIATMAGLYLMYAATTSLHLIVSGFLLGLGISGTGVTALIGAIGRMAPPDQRVQAMSKVSIGSGIGMLLLLPYTHFLIERLGWRESLLAILATAVIMIPMAAMLAGKPVEQVAAKPQTLAEALGEAVRHRGFWLLTAGFFVCGFHVTFVAVHLPGFVALQGLPSWVSYWALMAVGLFNIVGTLLAGYSTKFAEKRVTLALIYFGRFIVFLGFLLLPVTPWTVIGLSGLLGVLWLSTVPLTSGMVATFFGPTWMSMLFGIVFFSHQIGSFIGVWLGGALYDATKSYDMMWMISAGLGLFAALVHWPIAERPVPRLAVQAA